jgi:hypothetical protein
MVSGCGGNLTTEVFVTKISAAPKHRVTRRT